MSIGAVVLKTPVGLGQTLPAQCASCPFRDGNNEEWAAIVNRLRVANGMKPVKTNSRIVRHARTSVRIETGMQGTAQFACHHTAYDENMQLRPASEHRRCPGAVEFVNKLRSA